MLARNTPLVLTYLRACVLSTIIYCMLYGFSQWLESGAGFSSTQAGAIMLPMSVAAGISSFAGGRTKGIRIPFIVSIGVMALGCAALGAVAFGAPVVAHRCGRRTLGFSAGHVLCQHTSRRLHSGSRRRNRRSLRASAYRIVFRRDRRRQRSRARLRTKRDQRWFLEAEHHHGCGRRGAIYLYHLRSHASARSRITKGNVYAAHAARPLRRARRHRPPKRHRRHAVRPARHRRRRQAQRRTRKRIPQT